MYICMYVYSILDWVFMGGDEPEPEIWSNTANNRRDAGWIFWGLDADKNHAYMPHTHTHTHTHTIIYIAHSRRSSRPVTRTRCPSLHQTTQIRCSPLWLTWRAMPVVYWWWDVCRMACTTTNVHLHDMSQVAALEASAAKKLQQAKVSVSQCSNTNVQRLMNRRCTYIRTCHHVIHNIFPDLFSWLRSLFRWKHKNKMIHYCLTWLRMGMYLSMSVRAGMHLLSWPTHSLVGRKRQRN